MLFFIVSFRLTLGNSVQLVVLVPSNGDDAGLDLLTGGRVAVNEINNMTSLLKDYHIELLAPEYGHEACALRETSQGLVNFVQHSMHPPGQVLAVLGLYCSTSTKEISLLAGHKSVQLVQLSACSSSISDREAFHSATLHLWKFQASISTYACVMIELMTIFSWNDAVIIHTDLGNGHFPTLVDKMSDGILLQIDLSNQLLLNKSLDSIYNKGGRIIFMAASLLDSAKILCRAAERGMLYPDYMWIVTDHLLPYLEDTNQCDTSLLHLALNGSLLSHFSLEPQDKTVTLVNGDTYSTYESNYYKELDVVAEEYNQTLSGDHQYAGLLYDQVWAFALALNNSLPELSRRNLSVSDIGSLGYSKAKEILEKELSQLDFRGASGRIRFNNKREVYTPIDIYQVINGQQKSVGNCRVDNSSVTYCNITLTETPPSSELDVITKILKLPMGVIIIMHIVTTITVVLITTIMVLFLYNRKRPEIKATGWKLSILQFLACYLLCLSMTFTTLQAQYSYIAFCYIKSSLNINAIHLILVTSFVRVYRVYQIFHNKRLKEYGWKLSNFFLVFLTITLSMIPNVLLVLWFSLSSVHNFTYSSQAEIDFDGTTRYYLVLKEHCFVGVDSDQVNTVFTSLLGIYLNVFIIANIVFAFQTRKSYMNFKDTKKLILFIFMTWILNLILLSVKPMVVPQLINIHVASNSLIDYVYALCFALLCIVILYLPKLWWIKDLMFN